MAALDGNEIIALYAVTGTSISSGDEQYGYITSVGDSKIDVIFVEIDADSQFV